MKWRAVPVAASLATFLAIAPPVWAQRGLGGPGARGGPLPPPVAGRGNEMPQGKWWDRPELVKRIKLSQDQRRRMDDVFQQIRPKLIDLRAAVDKEEAAMEPLMDGAQLDDAKILPQIDRIADARAELEKAEARLVLGLRHVLTPEQWAMLQRRPPLAGRP